MPTTRRAVPTPTPPALFRDMGLLLSWLLLCAGHLACQPANPPCQTQADCGSKAFCYQPLRKCLPLVNGFDSGPPLPDAPNTSPEQSGACQQHECQSDATRCTTSGWLSRCVTHTVSGCRVWTPGAPCPQGLLCETIENNAACKLKSPYEAELQFCTDEINRHRKASKQTPLRRDPALEAYAAQAAESDAEDAKPHRYFNNTKGGGISRAENQIPGWPQSQYESIKKVIEIATQMMYNEGPGGGHHDNIVNPQFTHAGCGIHITPQGEIWINQEFR